MPGSPLRIVLVEDNPLDARLVLHELRHAGFEPEAVRAETEAEFVAHLAPGADVILCDYSLPQFDAFAALALARARLPDVPFLIVSGSIGEDVAVEAIKRGATDYVLKDRLRRLGPAVTRALEERQLRAAEQRGREELRASEARYRALADSIPQIVWTARPDGGLDYLNRRALEYSGLGPSELTGWGWEQAMHPDDRARAVALWGEALRTGEPREFECRLRRADGVYRWHLCRQVAMRDDAGALAQWFGTCTDVDDQRAATERQARDATLLASVGDAVIVTDPGGAVTYWNDGATRLFGWTADEMVGRPYTDRFPEPSRAAAADTIRARGGEWSGEFEDYHKDGARVWVDTRVTRIAGAGGGPAGVMEVAHDITARKRAEAALRESAERYRLLFESNPHPMWVYDLETLRFRAVNEAAVRMYGYTRAEFLGMTVRDIRPSDDVPRFELQVATLTPDATPPTPWRHRKKDGTVFDVEIASHEFQGDGRPARLVLALDATERKRAEAERDRQRRELQVILDAVPALIFYKDLGHRLVRVNREMVRVVGLPEDRMLGRTDAELGSPHAAKYARDEDEVVATGVAKRGLVEPLVTATGMRWMQTDKFPHRDDAGHIVGVIGFAVDVTDRKQAEESLGAVMRSVADAIITVDERGTIESVNRAAESIFGWPGAELIGQPVGVLMADRDRAGFAGYMAEYLRTGASKIIGAGREVTGRRKDGSTFPADLSVSEFRLDGVRRFTGVLRDVTERKRLEEQFLQAQKMEAFGQLAGGVAHDFNNLLTVINGFSEMALAEAPPGHPLREPLAAVRDAGERAAALTAQLLAFSRKSIIEPKVFDLNAVVDSIGKMLRRLIGEDIGLTIALSPTLSRVRADLGQTEQVIMNLAVNARDAMPTGGRLMIETADTVLWPADAVHYPGAAPGRYVRLVVSDTGGGMTDEVRARIFEPFFTTKGVGKGTGLGLATVHGIVTQAGGHIGVASVVGRGTAFTVLLPAVAEMGGPVAGGAEVTFAKGRETVLLVEDEEAVRHLARLSLESQGYTVVEASNGPEAIRAAGQYPGPIHLLVTDVVMPAMGGREVADAVRAQRGSVCVLFVSGYTDDAIVRHGVTAEGDAFLQKPFTPLSLARKVRDVLDARRRSSSH